MASLSTISRFKLGAVQSQNFLTWATAKYSTYEAFLAPAAETVIAAYIRTNIFTVAMKSVWRETEPYVGVRYYNDIHVGRLLMYRNKLAAKIKSLKSKLGKLAFPLEAAEILAQMERRRLHRFVVQLVPQLQKILVPLQKILVPLSAEEAKQEMEDECVICMDVHSMVDTCKTNCGHRFGAKCFAKWSKRSCPLCRTECTEVTHYFRD
jgi:hypothetical protein